MKRTIPLLIILLLLCGCSAAAQPPSPAVSSQKPAVSVTPSQKAQPNWHYELKNDGLYRTDQTTGQGLKINNNKYASDIVRTENWIYFIDNQRLYRMDNENRKNLLLDEDCWELNWDGEWLYYITKNGIFKMRPGGNEKTLLLQCKSYGMAVTDKFIFYAAYIPIEHQPGDGPPHPIGELHRIDLNGNNDLNLGVIVNYLGVHKNTVFYTNSKDYSLYSMNPETLERSAVYKKFFIETPCISNDRVFFITNHQLYKLSLADGTLKQMTPNLTPDSTRAFSWRSLGILDGYIYIYTDPGGPNYKGLYRINIDGLELEKVPS